MNKLNSKKFYLVLLINAGYFLFLYGVLKYRQDNPSAWNFMDMLTLAVVVGIDMGYLGLQTSIDGNWFKGKKASPQAEAQ